MSQDTTQCYYVTFHCNFPPRPTGPPTHAPGKVRHVPDSTQPRPQPRQPAPTPPLAPSWVRNMPGKAPKTTVERRYSSRQAKTTPRQDSSKIPKNSSHLEIHENFQFAKPFGRLGSSPPGALSTAGSRGKTGRGQDRGKTDARQWPVKASKSPHKAQTLQTLPYPTPTPCLVSYSPNTQGTKKPGCMA